MLSRPRNETWQRTTTSPTRTPGQVSTKLGSNDHHTGELILLAEFHFPNMYYLSYFDKEMNSAHLFTTYVFRPAPKKLSDVFCKFVDFFVDLRCRRGLKLRRGGGAY